LLEDADLEGCCIGEIGGCLKRMRHGAELSLEGAVASGEEEDGVAVVERSKAFDDSRGKGDGQAVYGIVVGGEIADKPVVVAGKDEVIGGVALKVGEGKDGEMVEGATGPEVFVGRVFAAVETDGGKIDWKDDARGDGRWSVVREGEGHQGIGDDDGLMA
jgi:hypothetical protein